MATRHVSVLFLPVQTSPPTKLTNALAAPFFSSVLTNTRCPSETKGPNCEEVEVCGCKLLQQISLRAFVFHYTEQYGRAVPRGTRLLWISV